MKRWIWIIAVALVAAVAIFLGMQPQPVAVQEAKVTTGPLRVTVEEEGKTRLRDRYAINAPVTGVMRRIVVKAGAGVAAGQSITTIQPPTPAVLDARTRDQGMARVSGAEAALSAAQARLGPLEAQLRSVRAERDYWIAQQTRDTALLKSGDLPSSRAERTRTELVRAEAAVAQAEKAIAAAEAELAPARAEIASARAALRSSSAPATGERIAVLVPAAGRVVRVVRDSEGVVTAGDPLLEVGDARAIEVVVEVLSADAVTITPGMRVQLDRWGGPKPLEARVRLVEPGGFTKISALGVEEQRVRVVADLVSPAGEWDALGDGYRVEASFILWEEAKVLQVPASALFRTNGDWTVFVIENGIARKRTVKVGRRSGIAAQILDGLREGESVVNHPDETVEEGKAVAPGK